MRGLANHAGLTLHVRLLAPGRGPPRHRGGGEGRRAGARGRGRAQPAGGRGPLDQGEPVSGRPRIAVLDYRVSNLRSAVKALELIGGDVRVTGDPDGVGGRRRRGAAGRGALRRGDAAHPRPRPGPGGPARRRRGRAGAGLLRGPAAAVRRERGEPGGPGDRPAAGTGAAPAHRPQAAAHRLEHRRVGAGLRAGAGGRRGGRLDLLLRPHLRAPARGRGPRAGPRRARDAVLRRRGAPGRDRAPVPPREVERGRARAARALAGRGARRRAGRPARRDRPLSRHRPAGRPRRAAAPGRLRPVHGLQRGPGGPGAGVRRGRRLAAARRRPRRRPRGPAGPRRARREHRRGVPRHGPPRRGPALARRRSRPRWPPASTASWWAPRWSRTATSWSGPSTGWATAWSWASTPARARLATHGWTQISDRDAVEVATELVRPACAGWSTPTSAATAPSAGRTWRRCGGWPRRRRP